MQRCGHARDERNILGVGRALVTRGVAQLSLHVTRLRPAREPGKRERYRQAGNRESAREAARSNDGQGRDRNAREQRDEAKAPAVLGLRGVVVDVVGFGGISAVRVHAGPSTASRNGFALFEQPGSGVVDRGLEENEAMTMTITKRGTAPSTNEIMNQAEHATGVLPADQQLRTGGLELTSTETLAKHKAQQMNADHRLHELVQDGVEHGVAEGIAHFAPALAAIAPLLTVASAAKILTEEVHADWQAGQDAKEAHRNDVADWALVGTLQFSADFKTAEHAKRPLVKEKDGLAIVAHLNSQPKHKAALQARADQGFQAAAKAFDAVKGLPTEKQAAALVATLKQSNRGTLQGDLAFGKGVEYFLFCLRDPKAMEAAAKDVTARSYEPPLVMHRL